MWPYLYDQVLPSSHEWKKQGGADGYFRLLNIFPYLLNNLFINRPGGYFHMLLVKVAGLYDQPVQNPVAMLEVRFEEFLKQVLNKIDLK